MKQFLKSLFTGYSAGKFVSALVRENALLCPECGTHNPVTAESALTFQNCGRCGFAILVPYQVAGFILFEPLGAGGISSVYKAYHKDTGDALYAVKLLRSECADDPDAVAVFLREAEIHGRVPDHPNIVRFVEGGCEDDEYFYAIEFVAGDRLQSLLNGGVTFPPPRALAITALLLDALQHILRHGILYRDVSAGNVILQKDQPVLIDFGLAMPVEEAIEDNHDRTVWGTGEFIPPERILRGGENESSVIYSLGMLLFHMVTGKAFVNSTTIGAHAKRHLSSARLAVTPGMMPGCPRDLVELVGRMIRQDPGERPQSFAEVAAAVGRMLPS